VPNVPRVEASEGLQRMNRRGFLGMFGAALATAVLDPEKLLWVPGRITYSLPPNPVLPLLLLEELNAVTLAEIYPILVSDNFYKSPLIYKFRQPGLSTLSRLMRAERKTA
jgi:hypothetical protein